MKYLNPSFSVPPPASTAGVLCEACVYGERWGPHSIGCKAACPHCGEKRGGAEGSIWCAECLGWWREQYAG